MQDQVEMKTGRNVVLNGIRLDIVGVCAVTQDGPEDMTDAEIAVAVKVGRKIAKMKRQGYQPELVARWIDRWVQQEALALGQSPGRSKAAPIEPEHTPQPEKLFDDNGGED